MPRDEAHTGFAALLMNARFVILRLGEESRGICAAATRDETHTGFFASLRMTGI